MLQIGNVLLLYCSMARLCNNCLNAAAPLSLIGNFVEIRTDAFKLAFNTRRPHATRCRDTGPWENITAIVSLKAGRICVALHCAANSFLLI